MNVPKQCSDEYITMEVHKWMKQRIKKLKQADTNDGTQMADFYATDDFGQIHFAKNDRKSWYVRFPFLLPSNTKSGDKSSHPQPSESPLNQSTQPSSTSKKKTPKTKVIHGRHGMVSLMDDAYSHEENSDSEEEQNSTRHSSVSIACDEGNNELREMQTNSASYSASTPSMYLRHARSKLIEEFDKKEDDENEIGHEKLIVTQATEIVDFMRNAWKLPVPELIISIAGGARFFEVISPLAHKKFQQDLVAAALATNAWVFTGGTNSGVMREVGDAYDKCRYKNTKIASRIPYIGVVSWYATTDYKQLEQSRDASAKEKPVVDAYLVFNKSRKDRERLYRTRRPCKREKPETFPLDHNHTHFLMLQDEFGEDDDRDQKSEYRDLSRVSLMLDLRAQIEEESRKVLSQGQSFLIPMVQILVNGGDSSIESICESIRRNTPIIVVNGSGRAADLIVYEYNYLYGTNSERSENAYEAAKANIDFQKYKRKREFGPKTEETLIKPWYREKFIEMIQSKKGYFLLNSFELVNGTKQQRLDDAIMEAQLNAARMNDDIRAQKTKKLQLAIAWSKYDRVTNDILTKETRLGWSDVDLDNGLKSALRRNSLNFVDILNEYGASFERLQRLFDVTDLYKDLGTNALLANLPVDQNFSLTRERISNSVITSLVENIGVPESQSLNLTSKEDDRKGKQMQSDYCATYFGKKITIHHPDFDQSIQHSASDHTYGIIDRERKSESFFNGMLVFSWNDIIRENGHITEISINFCTVPKEAQSKAVSSISLYVISPTKQKDQYTILHRHHLSEEEIKQLLNESTKEESSITNNCDIRRVVFRQSRLYLKAGEFLGIGFGPYSGRPYRVKGSDSCYIDLHTADEALKTGNAQLFIRQAIYCATFSFTMRPASSFIRDLLLWSLFIDRPKLAICLCSYSENTIAATLLCGKIYRVAAEIENQQEKRADYIQKARQFDNHAARLIESCYNVEEDFAAEILTTDSKLYFNYSPLQLASDSGSRAFLATNCVQKYLDKQWYGEVNKHGKGSHFINALILILCIIPPLIPVAAKYSKTLALNKPQYESSSRSEWSFVKFYRQRAIVRFYYNIIFYIGFLGLFSFVLLVDYFPWNNNGGKRNGFTSIGIPLTEILVHVGMLSIIVEEFIEFGLYYEKKRAYNSRSILWKYFADDKWNILDLVATLVYLLGFVTRFAVIEPVFIISKISMCIALFLWYVRILHLFVVSERLGTKLLMIFNTMKDLLFFVCFILIFLIGYSVASYSLVTTRHQIVWDYTSSNRPSMTYNLTQDGTGLWNWTIIRNVINWGMWKVYGQVDLLDYSQVDDNTLNADNDAYGTTVFILTIIFVCIANVLLLNVLVALFNVTLDKTKEYAHMSWAYHRFLLVNEYSRKSPLPPPINLFYYIYKLIKYLVNRYQNRSNNHIHGSLDGKSKLDSNIYDAITFNAMDQAKITGTIDTISINFSTLPVSDHPDIWLFVIKDTKIASSPNTFHIVSSHKLLTDAENINREESVQTFTTVTIPIRKGQYLGIRFALESGNPFAVERNQYYSYFDDKPYPNQPIEFTRCRTKGIAMSFNIQTETDVLKTNHRHSWLPIRRKKEAIRPPKQNDAYFVERNTYRAYDNMLRENSIAHGYWKNIIQQLREEERNINNQDTADETHKK